jgi:dTDP-4-dehydrorhamnose reductase
MTMRPLLVTGATGTLGQAFARLAELRGLAPIATRRDELDIADRRSVEAALRRHRPWAVVNAAGYVRVDDAEAEPERCRRENRDGPEILAVACAAAGIPLAVFSSDLVFDGEQDQPYHEDDRPAPLGVYGHSKLEAEQRVAAGHAGALIVRTSGFFGPWDARNFVSRALAALDAGQTVAAPEQVSSPTYVPDLVNATLDLLIDGEAGLRHLASQGALSWVELGRRVAAAAGHDPARVVATRPEALGWRARRPRQSALVSRHGSLLPTLDDALARYLVEVRRDGLPGGGR